MLRKTVKDPVEGDPTSPNIEIAPPWWDVELLWAKCESVTVAVAVGCTLIAAPASVPPVMRAFWKSIPSMVTVKPPLPMLKILAWLPPSRIGSVAPSPVTVRSLVTEIVVPTENVPLHTRISSPEVAASMAAWRGAPVAPTKLGLAQLEPPVAGFAAVP